MNPLLLSEWIAKAEEDFAVMQREVRVRRRPSYDAICFHAQQCAEKYLKARLYSAGIRFAKIHNLVALLDQSVAAEPSWEAFRTDLSDLTMFAVGFRYPGESANRKMTLEAAGACRRFRLAARQALMPGAGKGRSKRGT
jgi:HEPN domain-containing protein